MFRRRCRANDAGADMFCDLRRGNADAATRRMHENGLAPFQSAHDDHKLPRREVVDWKCCSFQGGHTRRAGKDLLHGYANHVRIAAEPGHGQDIAADPARIDIRARGIDASADLVTGHDRNWRQIRIEAYAAHDVCEIDADRFDANADFARLGLGIGRLPDGENLGWAKFRDPDLPHRLRSALASLRIDLYRVTEASGNRSFVQVMVHHLFQVPGSLTWQALL